MRPTAPTLLATLALLSARPGRALSTVALVQDRDRYSDCNAVMAEIRADNDQIGRPAREDGGEVGQHVAAGVAGPFVPVLYFAKDFPNACGKEGGALSQRDRYLATFAGRRCGHLQAEARAEAAPLRPASALR